MKKNIKFVLFILLMALIFITFMKHQSFAAIDLNINSNSNNSVSNSESGSNNTTSTNTSTTTNTNENLQAQYGNELDTGSTRTSSSMSDTSSAADVYSLNSLPESSLGLSNILSILLIAVGVILILLGIAVLIRLKK